MCEKVEGLKDNSSVALFDYSNDDRHLYLRFDEQGNIEQVDKIFLNVTFTDQFKDIAEIAGIVQTHLNHNMVEDNKHVNSM